MKPRYKIPQSVLVVIHTAALDVLLIRRADTGGQGEFWQSVTGAKERRADSWVATARREVLEETGIDCAAPGCRLRDWRVENVYDIYPRWSYRYGPDVVRNTERVFGLTVPDGQPVVLAPREHDALRWLPWREAADRCFSPSNAEAILQLPRRLAGPLGRGAR
jgi:dATP pyrophosphohydrolase